MKKWKLLMPMLVLTSLFTFGACDLSEVTNNILGGNNSSQNTTETNLQLLRVERTEEQYNGSYNVVSNNYYGSARMVMPMNTTIAKAEETQVEELETESVNLVAVIKNEDRASFIDMVVYNSQTGTLAVYNEGNGIYQCSSETVNEDGMWVTNIYFSTNVALVPEDFYFEIQEIKFLRNNADEKADLNTLEVRKKVFRFTTEYFDRAATQMLSQTIEGLDLGNIYCSVDLANRSVHIFGSIYWADENEYIPIACVLRKAEIICPETVFIQYYENRELKSGEFTVSLLRLEGIEVKGGYIMTIGELKVSSPILVDSGVSTRVHQLIYVEGATVCEFNNSFWLEEGTLSIPSTCEEIRLFKLFSTTKFTINYNGTMSDWYAIKGAEELIAWLESTKKVFKVVCADGIIKPPYVGEI